MLFSHIHNTRDIWITCMHSRATAVQISIWKKIIGSEIDEDHSIRNAFHFGFAVVVRDRDWTRTEQNKKMNWKLAERNRRFSVMQQQKRATEEELSKNETTKQTVTQNAHWSRMERVYLITRNPNDEFCVIQFFFVAVVWNTASLVLCIRFAYMHRWRRCGYLNYTRKHLVSLLKRIPAYSGTRIDQNQKHYWNYSTFMASFSITLFTAVWVLSHVDDDGAK